MAEAQAKIRLDKWLWYARFFKSRGLASKAVTGGHVRVNGDKVVKASYVVGPDDVLTFAQAHRIRVVQVVAVGNRRGPAPEAQTLYTDLTPPEDAPAPPQQRTGARPTKRNRRVMESFKSGNLP